jgi:hypothetical protein
MNDRGRALLQTAGKPLKALPTAVQPLLDNIDDFALTLAEEQQLRRLLEHLEAIGHQLEGLAAG